jgi:hypothetical protein
MMAAEKQEFSPQRRYGSKERQFNIGKWDCHFCAVSGIVGAMIHWFVFQ